MERHSQDFIERLHKSYLAELEAVAFAESIRIEIAKCQQQALLRQARAHLQMAMAKHGRPLPR